MNDRRELLLRTWRLFRYLDVGVTTVAAVFNISIIAVLCFVVIPHIDLSIAETRKNREYARRIQALLIENERATTELLAMNRELKAETESSRAFFKRLSAALDDMVKRAERLKAKEKADKEKTDKRP